LSFFPIFWLGTSATGSNDVGGVVALAVALLGLPMLLLHLWREKPDSARCPDGKGTYPECLFVVTVSDGEITNRRPGGETERIAVSDLREVSISTNDLGPFEADVWWHLAGPTPTSGCRFPMGATGETEVLKFVQRLPGFDNERFIQAM